MLHNVYVVEELIQLTVISDAEKSSSSQTSADFRTKYLSLYSNDMGQPAYPLIINKLRNANVVEELIQFIVGSDAEMSSSSKTSTDSRTKYLSLYSNDMG